MNRTQCGFGTGPAVLLIAVGALLLLDNLGYLSLEVLRRLWPLGLIAAGVHQLLFGGTSRREAPDEP